MGSKNIFLRKWYFTIISLLCSAELFAKPHGMRTKHGHAKITKESESELHIEVGDKAVLEWKSFSIGKNEKTVFVQPGKHSTVLNRVTTGSPSDILGTLEANGRVYLINPNGILVGKDAYINVSGFLASTLDILDNNFLQGDTFTFEGRSTNAVVNRGSIKAIEGDVFLIGRYVQNEGSIEASSGIVGLAAGREVLLQLKDGNRHIYIRPKEEKESAEGIGIENNGTIRASQVMLAAEGSLYNLAIKNVKQIDAIGFKEKEGRIYISAEGGKIQLGGALTAKNAEGSGGEIKAVASEVETTTQSKFDVSAVNGDAGKIYLHGKDRLSVVGTMKATGGSQKGNGGLIELETQGVLDFKVNVDMKAASGQVGNLVFRAPDIRISSEKSSSTSILTTAFVQKALLHSNISIYSGKDITIIEGIGWDSSKTAKSPTAFSLKASEAIHLGSEKSTKQTYLVSSNLQAAGKTVLSLEAPFLFIGNEESEDLSLLNPKSGDVRMVTSFLGVYGGGVGNTQKSDTSAKIFANDGDIFIDTFKDSVLHIELKAGSGPISPAEIATDKGNIRVNMLGNATEGSLTVLGGSGDNSGAMIATIHSGDVEVLLPTNSNYLLQGGNSSIIGYAQIVAADGGGSKGSVKLDGGNYTLKAGSGLGNVRARISGDVAPESKDAVLIKMNGTFSMESGQNQAEDSRVMVQGLGGGALRFETDDQGRMNFDIKGGDGNNSAAIIETNGGGGILVNTENKAKEGDIYFEAGSGKQSSVRILANDGGDISLNMPVTANFTIKGGSEAFKHDIANSLIDSSVLISTKKGHIFLQGKEFLLAGGSVSGGAAKVINENGGITMKFANNVNVQSGTHKGSDAVIRANGPLDIYASGDILLGASGEGMALLQSFGPANIIARNSILLRGDNGGKACIQNKSGKTPGKGKLHIEAGRDVNLQGSSIIQNLADEIVMVSGEKMTTGSKSMVKSGEGITFVVDKQSYTSGIYKFGLTVDPGADIDGPPGHVHLFTSSDDLNSIPPYLKTFQRHGSHYPNKYKGEENYVVHYRSEGNFESERVVVWNLVNVLNSQLFYNLYSQYDDIYHRKIEFSIADQVFSPWKDLYGIKRQSRFQFTYGLPGDK